MNPAISLIPSTLLIAMSFVAGCIEPEPRNGVQPNPEPSVAIWGDNQPSVQGSDIEPLSVTRPTAGVIEIRGATYARITPDAPVTVGIPIALASMGWSTTPEGIIRFAVQSNADYEVSTLVFQYTDDGDPDYSIDGVQESFDLPRSRQHKVQRWLEIAIEMGQIEIELGGRDNITWPEISAALAAIREEDADDAIPTGLEASQRHSRDIEAFHREREADRADHEPEQQDPPED